MWPLSRWLCPYLESEIGERKLNADRADEAGDTDPKDNICPLYPLDPPDQRSKKGLNLRVHKLFCNYFLFRA